jgi:hypothetical protein
LKRTIKMVRPEMCSSIGIDKLTGDPNTVSGPAHTAFQHATIAEIAADPLHVHHSALVS